VRSLYRTGGRFGGGSGRGGCGCVDADGLCRHHGFGGFQGFGVDHVDLVVDLLVVPNGAIVVTGTWHVAVSDAEGFDRHRRPDRQRRPDRRKPRAGNARR